MEICVLKCPYYMHIYAKYQEKLKFVSDLHIWEEFFSC